MADGQGDKETRTAILIKCLEAKNVPVSTLEKLAADKNYDVRRGVAENTSTPVSTLEKKLAAG